MTTPQALANSPKTFLDRDNWMRAVLASDLPPIVRLVAVRIALHLRVKTGQCDPGYAALARELRISERSVIRMVAMLEHTGWITVVRAGWHHTNRYVLLWGDRGDKVLSPLRGDKALSPQNTSEVTNSDVRGDKNRTSEVTHAVTQKAKRTAKRKEGKKDSPALRARESDSAPGFFAGDSKKDSPRKEAKSKPNTKTESGEGFERFWAAYPRKVAKDAARKPFAKAIENGAEPETLIAGAQRYAAERAGQDPKYTKHAKTWLNAGCWQDEMPPGAVIDQSGAIVAIEQPPPQREDEKNTDELFDETFGPDWRTSWDAWGRRPS